MTKSLLVIVLLLGCGGADEPLAFDDFLGALPDAVCDYYARCGLIGNADHASCVADLADDLERDLACNAARGLYPGLAGDLARCLDDAGQPCGATDDLELFCPNLDLLERECTP